MTFVDSLNIISFIESSSQRLDRIVEKTQKKHSKYNETTIYSAIREPHLNDYNKFI